MSRIVLGSVADRGTARIGYKPSNVFTMVASSTTFNIPFGRDGQEANIVDVFFRFGANASPLSPGALSVRFSTDSCVTVNSGNIYSYTNVAEYSTGTSYKQSGLNLQTSVLLDNSSTIGWSSPITALITGRFSFNLQRTAANRPIFDWEIMGYSTATNFIACHGKGSIISATLGLISGIRIEAGAATIDTAAAEVWARVPDYNFVN